MCDCDICTREKEESNKIRYSISLVDLQRDYNGPVPFSVLQVLDKDYNTISPAQAQANADIRPINSRGYVETYFAKELAELDKIFYPKFDTLPKTVGKFFAVIVTYNTTD